MKVNLSRVCAGVCIGLAAFLLSGCAPKQKGFAADGRPEFSNPAFTYVPPPVLVAQTSEEPKYVVENNGRTGMIDVAHMAQGYVMVGINSEQRARVRVSVGTQGQEGYQEAIFDLANGGIAEPIPLNFGNGHYTIVIFVSMGNPDRPNEYEFFLTAEEDVVLESEFAPFLINSQNSNFSENSTAVILSHEIAGNASSKLEVAQQIYFWVFNNISYDHETADAIVQTGGKGVYIPDLEKIMQTKKGICFDYAALTAAMLRANGIPTQMVKGDVMRQDGTTILHAWNNIWIEEVGWVSIGIPTTPEEWMRIDTTFAASKDPDIAKFIGDGKNYFPLGLL